jgi:VWFA-related protein
MLVPCASIMLAASGLFGQETTIRTDVPLVVLPVSITDRNGRFVYGLASSDFLLLDDGKPRAVRVDSADSELAPLALVVLIQTSDISQSALLKIRKVGTMIQEAVVGANGEAAVVTFSDKVRVAQDFTNRADEISNAFRDLRSEDTGEGRMLDAVAKALDLLANRAGGARSSILIVGESRDRGSETKLKDLLPAIQRSAVTIYSISYSAYLTPFTTKASEYSPPNGGGLLKAITETGRLGKQNTSQALTDASGGRRLSFATQSKLENDLIRLGSEIHSRYVVSFTPDRDQGTRFHTLEVKIKDRPQFVVRTRRGYRAEFGFSQQR